MIESKRLELRKSEVAEKLSGFASREELSDEETAEMRELTQEAGTLESRYQAAVRAEDLIESRAEPIDRELEEVRSNATLSGFLRAAVAGVDVSGAEAEYRSATLGSNASASDVPIDLLAPTEDRAVDTADISGAVQTRPVLPRVFETPVTRMLGISPTIVPTGQARYIVFATGATPAATAEGTLKAAEDATFTATSLAPKRVTTGYELTSELSYELPGIEDALRRDLTASLANQVEKLLLTGDGTGANPSGLTNGLTQIPHGDRASATTYNAVIGTASQQVDGIYANSAGDVRLVAPIDAYRYAFTVSQTSGDATAAEVLMRNSGGFLASAHLPNAPSSGNRDDISDILFVRGNVAGWYAYPVWQNVQIIRDPYSLAQSGQVRLTITAFLNFDVIRSSAVGYDAWKIA